MEREVDDVEEKVIVGRKTGGFLVV